MSVTCLDTKNVLILVNFIEMNCLCFVEIQDVVTLILSESSMKEVACCFCKWWSDVWMFLQRQVSSYSHKTDEKWWKKADILSWESSTQRYKWCRIKVKLSFFSLTSRLKTPSRGCRASRTSTSWNSGTVCCFLYCLSTLSLKMFGDRKLNTSESVHFGWTWCMLWCSLSVSRPQKDLERWVSQTFLLFENVLVLELFVPGSASQTTLWCFGFVDLHVSASALCASL